MARSDVTSGRADPLQEEWTCCPSPIFAQATVIRGSISLASGERTEIMHVIGWKTVNGSSPEYRARILAHIRSILLERYT